MSKSIQIQSRIESIAKELANGQTRGTIVRKFTTKWKIGKTIIDKYIKEAKPMALILQQQTQKSVTDKANEEAKELFKGAVLTKLEKQDILRRIARGEYLLPKKIVVNGVVKIIQLEPDFSDVLKAIDLDNKMAGDNAPNELHAKLEGIKIIPPQIIIHGNKPTEDN